MRTLLTVFLLTLTTGSITQFYTNTSFAGPKHDGYLELAQSLYHHQSYSFSKNTPKVLHRPPLYVALLLPATPLPPTLQKLYTITLNALLLTATAYIILQLAPKLSLLVLLSNPFLLFCLKNPMPIFLQTFLYTLLIYLFVKKANPLKLGLTTGLLSLTHGTGLPISLTLIGILLFKKQFKKASLTLLLTTLIIAPWTLRNYSVSSQFIPVVSNTGHLYFAGNKHWNFPAPPIGQTHFWGLTNPSEERQLTHLALQDILHNPLQFTKKLVLNATYLFFPAIKSTSPITLTISTYYALLFLLAFLTIRKSPKLLPWTLPILLAAAPYLPFLTFIGHNQYAFLSMPFFSIIIGNYVPK